MNEQQEIDDYITHIIEKWKGLERDRDGNRDGKKLILDLASFLEGKGYRSDGIYDEIVHLLKDEVKEIEIRPILYNTIFLPSVNLKVYDTYTRDMGSKTAYIHRDVMTII